MICERNEHNDSIRKVVERVHFAFHRQLFGVRTSRIDGCCYVNLVGCQCFTHYLWSYVVKFVVSIQKLDDMSPLKQAYLAQVDLLRKGKRVGMEM